jgi:hypothetical protein
MHTRTPSQNYLKKIFIHQLPAIYRLSSNSFIYPIVKNGGGIYSNSREYYESTKKTVILAGLEGDYEECSNKENISGASNISKPDLTEEALKNRSTSLWEQWIKERVQHLIKDDFDFALVLKPNSEYSFWADRLDFRPEAGVISYSGLLNIKLRSDGVQLDDCYLNKSISSENQTNVDPVQALFSAKKYGRRSVFDLAMDIAYQRKARLLRTIAT